MNKKEKAEFLFEEIGGIDESLLYECGESFPRKRKEKRLTLRMLIASVALFSALILVVSGIGIASVVGILSSLGGNKEEPFEPSHSGTPSDVDTQPTAVDIDTDILFSGTPSIIYTDENEMVYAVKIAERDYREVKRFSASPKGQVQSGDGQTMSVWISDGHGAVFTPYLENSAGNVYYGQIPDYRDEVVPNDQVTNLLKKLLP